MLKIINQFEDIQEFCGLPFTKLILNSWGEVSMCCHQIKQIGKIDKDSNILDIWNCALAQEIRQETNKGNLHKVCKSWSSCPFIVSEKKWHNVTVHKELKYPTYIEICLPDKHCNVGGEKPNDKNPACIMCRRNFNIPDQPDLTDLICEKVLPIMSKLRHLCVLGIAEPFWKDAVFMILKKLMFEKYKHQCEFRTNTNGICINEKTAVRFFENVEISDVSWSIDAATPETHEKIRRLNTFDLVVENLKRWISLKSDKHRVSIYNNINMLNVHEMSLMVKMAKEIGVDCLILLPTHDQTGVVKLGELILCEKNVEIFKRESEKARELANSIGLNLIYPTKFDTIPKHIS